MSTERDEAFEKFERERSGPLPYRETYCLGYEAGRQDESNEIAEGLERRAAEFARLPGNDGIRGAYLIAADWIRARNAQRPAPSAPPKGQGETTGVGADARWRKLLDAGRRWRRDEDVASVVILRDAIDALAGFEASPPEVPLTEARVRILALEMFELGFDREQVYAEIGKLQRQVKALEAARGEPASQDFRLTPQELAAREAVVDAAVAWAQGPASRPGPLLPDEERLVDAVNALPSKPPSAPSRPEPGEEATPAPFACAGCGLPFWSRASLTMHINVMHPDEEHSPPAEPSATGAEPPAVEEVTAKQRAEDVFERTGLRDSVDETRDAIIDQISAAESAARAAALEEAARTAETQYRRDTDGIDAGWDTERVRGHVQRRIAAAIRSLLHSPAAGAKKGPA